MDISKVNDALTASIFKSRKIMLREKALHNEDVVVGDGNGGVRYINAREFLETHPEFRL